MKYIIFNSANSLLGLAKTDAIKDDYIAKNAGANAISVSDSVYSDFAKNNISVKLVDGSIQTTSVTSHRESDVSNASDAQTEYQAMIDKLKKEFEERKKDRTEVANMITFLGNIDTSSVTSWAVADNIINHIYGLTNCPQIYVLEYQV